MKAFIKKLIVGSSLFFLNTQLTAAAGTIVNFEEQFAVHRLAQLQTVDSGPTLIFSDSPENIKRPGIAYRDLVSGEIRIFFHHVNETADTKILAVLLRNRSLAPIKVTVTKRGVSGPDKDWMRAGQIAQQEYFMPYREQSFTIGVLDSRELLSGKNGLKFEPWELITGIIDLKISGQAELSVLMSSVHSDAAVAADTLPILPVDQEPPLRGTFANANRRITVANADENDPRPLVIRLADGVEDKFLRGVDALTGKPAYNYGNYGVVYTVDYLPELRKTKYWGFNAEGGYYAGVGVLRTAKSEQYHLLPPVGSTFGQISDNETIIAPLPHDYKGSFLFSPPGSSNLPIRIIFYDK